MHVEVWVQLPRSRGSPYHYNLVTSDVTQPVPAATQPTWRCKDISQPASKNLPLTAAGAVCLATVTI